MVGAAHFWKALEALEAQSQTIELMALDREHGKHSIHELARVRQFGERRRFIELRDELAQRFRFRVNDRRDHQDG